MQGYKWEPCKVRLSLTLLCFEARVYVTLTGLELYVDPTGLDLNLSVSAYHVLESLTEPQ